MIIQTDVVPVLTVAVPTAILTAAASAGVVWGTLKATVNGTVGKVKEIHEEVRNQGKDLTTLKVDMAYLKGRLTDLVE